MNLQQIISRVQSQFGDTEGVQIKTSEITDWSNDAVVDINRKTEYLRGSSTIDVVDGTYIYDVPTDSTLIKRVEYDGVKLIQTTFEELDLITAAKKTDTEGVPRYWYLWGSSLYLHPVPDTTLSSGINVFYIKRPGPLVNYSDVPELPTEYHEDIVRYCLVRAKEKDEEYDQATTLKFDYDQRLSQSRYDEQNKQNASYPAVRILPGDD